MSADPLRVGDVLLLAHPTDSDDMLRATFQGLNRACASERSEINRLSGLRATQYGDEDTYQPQIWRAKARLDRMESLAWSVEAEMNARNIEPW